MQKIKEGSICGVKMIASPGLQRDFREQPQCTLFMYKNILKYYILQAVTMIVCITLSNRRFPSLFFNFFIIFLFFNCRRLQ